MGEFPTSSINTCCFIKSIGKVGGPENFKDKHFSRSGFCTPQFCIFAHAKGKLINWRLNALLCCYLKIDKKSYRNLFVDNFMLYNFTLHCCLVQEKLAELETKYFSETSEVIHKVKIIIIIILNSVLDFGSKCSRD